MLEAPSVSREVDRAARSLAGGPERSLDIREETRLYAVPVVENGVRYGTVVSAVSLDPYEETGHTALDRVARSSPCVVLAAIAALAWWMLGRALLPVSRMTEDAASWSEYELDRRFGLGEPYDELTRLAARSTPARPHRGERPARATLHRRALPRAAYSARAHQAARRSSSFAASARRTNTERALAAIQRSVDADDPHRGDARRCRAPGGGALHARDSDARRAVDVAVQRCAGPRPERRRSDERCRPSPFASPQTRSWSSGCSSPSSTTQFAMADPQSRSRSSATARSLPSTSPTTGLASATTSGAASSSPAHAVSAARNREGGAGLGLVARAAARS